MAYENREESDQFDNPRNLVKVCPYSIDRLGTVRNPEGEKEMKAGR